MRIQLREARAAEDEAAYYARVYPGGYRHDVWPDHVERVAASVELIKRYTDGYSSAADLSCGDGAILRALSRSGRLNQIILGDLNRTPDPALDLWRQGSRYLEVTALPPGPLPGSLNGLPDEVDLFVLSETLEHMPDPDGLLLKLTDHARYLFVSTPVSEIPTSGNLEHYWSWGTDDIQLMLRETGWHPLEMKTLIPRSTLTLENAYHYQLWIARRA